MSTTIVTDISPDVVEWAKSWAKKDPEYIVHASKFGSPLVRHIASLILSIAGETPAK